MAATIPFVTLNNGVRMPTIGLGTCAVCCLFSKEIRNVFLLSVNLLADSCEVN